MTDADLKSYWLMLTESFATYIAQAPGPIVSGQRVLLADPFMLRVEMIPGQGGTVGFRQTVLPIELVAGFPHLPYETVSIVPIAARCLDELKGGKRREIVQLIENADRARMQARAAERGILVASAMPKA